MSREETPNKAETTDKTETKTLKGHPVQVNFLLKTFCMCTQQLVAKTTRCDTHMHGSKKERVQLSFAFHFEMGCSG